MCGGGKDMVTPTRNFNLLYIVLDSVFILVLLLLLFFKKERRALIFALFGGILYFIVDYGMFYGLNGGREVLISNEKQGPLMTAWVLLWMSLSYGITNFTMMWLALKKSRNLIPITGLIVLWWLCCPLISVAGGEMNICTFRTTDRYHWIMAVILFVGYFILIMLNLFGKKDISILYLFVVGFLIQFFWEAALLVTGIRPFNDQSIRTLLVDSLVETNLGMPIAYGIYAAIRKKWGNEADTDDILSCVHL